MWDLQKYAANVAIVENGTVYTYADIDEISACIASQIGDRTLVFCLCHNTVATVAGYVGCINNRIVPLMVDSGIDDDLLSSLIECYKPSFIWAPADSGHACIADYESVYSAYDYELLDTKEQQAPVLFEDLALLMSTSGSTGSPKLVRLSYANLESNTKAIVEYLKIGQDERAIASLQLSYVYGLSVLNTHLWAGACVILTELACYTKGFWDLFAEQSATSFAGVPFMYEMLDKLRFTKKPAPATLRTMTQAGGKLSPQLHERFAQFAQENGFKFVVMYGASEATARMGYLPAEYALPKAGSMGIPIPGGRFELVDDDGQVVEASNVSGELVYYGDNVSLGYSLSADDLAKGDENHGRLATGDVAQHDDDGFYRIVGRKKRFVKMLGKRINLDEVESILKRRLGIIDVACVGVDDLIGVFLIDQELQEQAQSCVHETIGVNARQVKVTILDEIPKNPSGKTLFATLEKML